MPPACAPLLVSIMHQRQRIGAGMEVKALDAAMPFDFEHKASATLDRAKRLTVGIVGFGTFGQFLAKRLVQAGHQVRVASILTCLPPLALSRILSC